METSVVENVIKLFTKHGIKFKTVVLNRRNNNFKDGDYSIPKGCHEMIGNDVLSSIQGELLQKMIGLTFPVSSVSGDGHNSFIIYMDRTELYRRVVTKVLKMGINYGHCEMPNSQHVLINNMNFVSTPEDGTQQAVDVMKTGTNLDTLRSIVLLEHVFHLLKARGYKVTSTGRKANIENHTDLLSMIGIDPDQMEALLPNDAEHKTRVDNFVAKHPCVQVSSPQSNVQMSPEQPYCTDDTRTEQPHDGITCQQNNTNTCDVLGDNTTKLNTRNHHVHNVCTMKEDTSSICDSVKQDIDQSSNVCEFNLRQYIQSKELPVGKSGFDKNLNICNVHRNGVMSEDMQTTCMMHAGIQASKANHCLHVVSQQGSFSQQKCHLLLQALYETDGTSQCPTMHHLVYGPVTQKTSGCGTESLSSDQYYRLRHKQMKQAAILKYGDTVQGDGWSATLHTLTSACVKFEILSSTARNTLKLNTCDDVGDNSGDITLTGSFVMYNCARLATLFSHFEDAVNSGQYPNLPNVEDIDFTTLREEQEWSLLFNYVDQFPEIVKQCTGDYPSTTSITANIHTHKICQMLSNMSRSISSYYSRYHVLGESRPHLLPMMYARLYLLKAVYQVMINGLSLLGIQPLSQL